MSDYRNKLEEWQRAARRKAREMDEKYDLKGRVQDGARAAQDAARFGADSFANGAERLRAEAERFGDDKEFKDSARRAAQEATRRAREAGQAFRNVAGTAGERAEEAFGSAKSYYERASRFYTAGAYFTRASGSAMGGLLKARDWVKENPGKTVIITFSVVTGVRLGASFPALDAVLLGSHPHWLTHSALPVYGLRKASEKFDEYLSNQEELIAKGDVSEADRRRIEFERNITKYVGAPLLGAFSCAAGAALCAQIFLPGRITGAPISWLLGGNPFLDGVWLFANGVLCFHQGYKFFMIALANQDEVARVIREIKGLLPAGASA